MDPDPRKEIEVDPDPDLDPERELKWVRIRPNAVDPGGSGSETLFFRISVIFPHCQCLNARPQIWQSSEKLQHFKEKINNI